MDSVESTLSKAVRGCDYVLVDTPGTFFLSPGLHQGSETAALPGHST